MNSIDRRSISSDVNGARHEEKRVLKHVQEVLFEKKLKGIYARDSTDKAKSIKIGLAQV